MSSPLMRRGRIEVFEELLKEARKGTPKTRLMYRCNLNLIRFRRYFKYLQDKGLIAQVSTKEGRVIYKTTRKGEEFLEAVQKLRKYIDL